MMKKELLQMDILMKKVSIVLVLKMILDCLNKMNSYFKDLLTQFIMILKYKEIEWEKSLLILISLIYLDKLMEVQMT